jgi:hypothetical protein
LFIAVVDDIKAAIYHELRGIEIDCVAETMEHELSALKHRDEAPVRGRDVCAFLLPRKPAA